MKVHSKEELTKKVSSKVTRLDYSSTTLHHYLLQFAQLDCERSLGLTRCAQRCLSPFALG